MSAESLATVTLVVPSYDAGIAFYIDKLGFNLVDNTDLGNGKRWVVVGPKGGANLLLAEAANDPQLTAIGNQTGGRVFLFLYTDDFWRDYEDYRSKGVEFIREPAEMDYGTVSVFKDLYGNLWDLVEKKTD